MAKTLLILGAMLLLLVGLLSDRIGSALNRHPANFARDTSNDRKKTYTVELASGLDYRLGAYPETRLLHFDECRIEKRKHGGFSFGAFNVLVIDQLEITLPPLAKRLFDGRPEGVGFAGIASRKQVEKTFQRLLTQYPRFSSVRVNGLSVGRVDPLSGNGKGGIEKILTARTAETGTRGVLNLSSCEFLAEGGERIRCRNAELSLEPPFLVSTEHGTFRIANFSGGQCMGLASLIRK